MLLVIVGKFYFFLFLFFIGGGGAGTGSLFHCWIRTVWPERGEDFSTHCASDVTVEFPPLQPPRHNVNLVDLFC